MKYPSILLALLLLGACKPTQKPLEGDTTFVLAFGSCNKPELKNHLWDDILRAKPDVWVWGGDNVYADTEDMDALAAFYSAQNAIPDYAILKAKVPVIGTWDDHDYGVNDGGREFAKKRESQQRFLDFLNVPAADERRQREGVYTQHDFAIGTDIVKVIVLDTRYFRSAITPDNDTEKRLKPNAYGEGTLLGEAQWSWLANTLNTSKAKFNIVISSIQLLSNEHGFEAWGNFPHEVDKFKRLVAQSRAKGVVVLSGDRHISEFSRTDIAGLPYPLVDFTSSGLTHAYSDFSGEPNPFRVGEVISTETFGLLEIDLAENDIQFKIVADDGAVLATLGQAY